MRIYLVVVLFLLANQVLSQDWVMKVEISGSVDCSGELIENAINATFNAVRYSTSGDTDDQLAFTQTSSVGDFIGPISISAHGRCLRRGGGRDEMVDGTFNGEFQLNYDSEVEGEQCKSYAFSGFDDSYRVRVSIQIYRPLSTPVVKHELNCSAGIVQVQELRLASSYRWSVSENGNAPWYVLTGKTTASIDVTAVDLYRPGFTGPNRYLKVEDPTCPSRGSLNTSSFVIYARSPTAIPIPSFPTCNGKSNGSIDVAIMSSDSNVTSFFYQLYYQSANLGGSTPDLPIIQKYSPQDPPPFTDLAAGKYKIRVVNNTNTTDLGTCSSLYENIEIRDPPAIMASLLTQSNISCHTDNTGTKNDGSIQLKVDNGTANYSYQYKKGSGSFASVNPASNDFSTTTPLFNGLTEGDYVFTVTDANGCASETAAFNVGQPTKLAIATVGSSINVICKSKATGAINVAVTGGNAGTLNYQWSGSGGYSYSLPSIEDVSSAYAGNYSLTVTDSKSCSATYTNAITEPATALVVQTNPITNGGYNISCAGNDGGIDLTYQNKTYAISSYEWKKNGNPLFPTPSNPESISNLGAGTYTIKVTDTQSCDATASVALTVNPGITVQTQTTSLYTNGFNTTCSDSEDGAGKVSGVLNNVGTLSYAWAHDSSLNSPIVSDLRSGTYTVTVTDAGNHCTNSASLIITGPPAIAPNLQVALPTAYHGTQISCKGEADGRIDAAPTNGAGIYQYLWKKEGSNLATTANYIDGLTKGNYEVIVEDDNGCKGTQAITIIEPPEMKFVFNKKNFNGSDLSCFGKTDGEVQLTVINGLGASSSFQYAWSNATTNKDLSGIGSGDYTVIVTDGNQCVKDSSVTINNPAELLIDMQHMNNFNGFDISCFNGTNGGAKVVPSGGTGSIYIYAWSNGKNTDVNSPLSMGSYSVTVTDVNGCNKTGNITMTQPSLLTATTATDNPVSCFGLADGRVSLNGAGGVTPYVYSRDQGTWQPINQFENLDVGSKDFYLKDANNCIIHKIENVPQPIALSLTFQDRVDAACNDTVGSVRAVVTGGNGGFSYSWLDESNSEAMNTGEVLTHAKAGIYRVNVIDAKDCVISDVTNISSIGGALFTVNSITPVSCFGYQNGSATINVTSGTSPFNYSWSDGQLTAQASSLIAGKYFATVEDGLGCKTIQQVTINTPDAIATQHEKTLPLCLDDCNGQIKTTPIGGTAPYSFQWITLNKSTDLVTGLCAGNYALKITDAQECILEQNVELKNPEALSVTPALTKATCLGRCDGAITVSGTGGTGPYTFSWKEQGAGATLTNLCPDEYSVEMKDAHGCVTSQKITLEKSDPLPLNLGTKATLCVGQSKELDAGSQWVQSVWTSTVGFNSAQPKVIIKDPGIYYFKGIDALSCVALDTFRLETSLDLLKAEFLMPSEVFVGDTLVAIDITWPLPERVEWTYPSSFKRLPSDVNEVLYAQLPEAGTFTIGMKSFLAECRDLREKILRVLVKGSEAEEGRLGFEEFVQTFTLFPNPNDGRFSVKIVLAEKSSVRLRVVRQITGTIYSDQLMSPFKEHLINYDLSDLPTGAYVILLEVNDQQKYIRFLKQ